MGKTKLVNHILYFASLSIKLYSSITEKINTIKVNYVKYYLTTLNFAKSLKNVFFMCV